MIESRRIARVTAALVGTAILALTPAARANTPQRSLTLLTTGNGYGFQVFDVNKNGISYFLDHPYRYVGPPPSGSPAGTQGPSRRNLAYSVYFGLHAGQTSGWLNAPTSAGSAEYTDDANIIHVPAKLGVNVDSYFFAPFGYAGNAMVALMSAPGATDGFALFNFHMGSVGSDPDAPDSNNESSRPVSGSGINGIVETGPGGGAMVYVALNGLDHSDCSGAYAKVQAGQNLGSGETCSQSDVVPAFEKTLGSDGWMAVAMQYVDDPTTADAAAKALVAWANNRSPATILSDAQTEFESWRVKPASDVALCNNDETHLWRQSEAVLRMGQILETNASSVKEAEYSGPRVNHGMILASLPVGQWHTGWVRDGTFATVALARMGHYAEAKEELNFLLGATAGTYKSYVKNQSYQVSVCRYYGSGQEESDYSGNLGPNVELDDWGLVMWAARQYVQNSGDTAWLTSKTSLGSTVYDAIANGIAAPLEANLEPEGFVVADSSIWEVHEGAKEHFAWTSLAAARGFCDMAVLAQKAGQSPAHYQQLSTTAKAAILANFVDSTGALGGSLEGLSTGVYTDASVAGAFIWNLLPSFTDQTATATLKLLGNLQVPSGGFKRNNNSLSDYDNNEWILIDLLMSNSYQRAGQTALAAQYLSQNVAQAAANFYLLPELYNAIASEGTIGVYTGSIPMVGYGGGAYIMTILDRAGKIEPNDCGNGNGVTLPALTCSGSRPPGGDGGGGTTGGDGGGGTTGGDSGDGWGTTGGSDSGTYQVGNGDNGVPNAKQLPYAPACLCDLTRLSSSRAALPLLAFPLLLLRRRLRRTPR